MTNPWPRRCRAFAVAWLAAGLASPRAPAIAEWRVDSSARVPGETGLTEILAHEAPRPTDEAVRPVTAPRYASGRIRRAAPVVEAEIRPVSAVLAAAGAEADDAPFAASQPGADPLALAQAEPLGDDALDSLRGGFETPDGLQFSFGIERLVYVNGELASVTSINVSDLGKLTGGASAIGALPAAGSTIALIQNGTGNVFAAGELSSAALATVIQNSLDNQRIQAVTTITATVNSMEMLRAQRLQQSLQDALNHSLLR